MRNTNKYRLKLLSVIFATPLLSFAQVGKKVIPLSSGETTVQVKPTVIGTESKELRRSPNDSMFYNMNTNYRSLEDAAYDLARTIQDIEESQRVVEKKNDALSYRIAKGNVLKIKDVKETENRLDSLQIFTRAETGAEIAALREKYGNKPTYYINGMEVDESLTNRLRRVEIRSRTVRTTRTASGNPNGEVLFEVPDATMYRLGLLNE